LCGACLGCGRIAVLVGKTKKMFAGGVVFSAIGLVVSLIFSDLFNRLSNESRILRHTDDTKGAARQMTDYAAYVRRAFLVFGGYGHHSGTFPCNRVWGGSSCIA